MSVSSSHASVARAAALRALLTPPQLSPTFTYPPTPLLSVRVSSVCLSHAHGSKTLDFIAMVIIIIIIVYYAEAAVRYTQ